MSLWLRLVVCAVLAALGVARPASAQAQAENDDLIGCVMSYGYLTDQSGAGYNGLLAKYAAILVGDFSAAKADIGNRLSDLVARIGDGSYADESRLIGFSDECATKYSVAAPAIPPSPKMPGYGAKLPADPGESFESARMCAGIFYHYAFGRSASFDDMIGVMRMIDPTVSQFRAAAVARVAARDFAASDVADTFNVWPSLKKLDDCYENFGVMPPFLGADAADTRAKADKRLPPDSPTIWRAMILAAHYGMLTDEAESQVPEKAEGSVLCPPLLKARLAQFALSTAWTWVGNRERAASIARQDVLDSSEANARTASQNAFRTSDTITQCREEGYLH